MTKADEYNRKELDAGRLTWAHVTEAIRQAQIASEESPALVVDGMAGPATRRALERAGRFGKFAPTPPSDRLAELGQVALDRALELWRENVRDPKASDQSADADADRAVIDRIVRGLSGAGWSWLPRYLGDGAVEWCGMFAAAAWSHAVPLEIRTTHFPSCYRLDAWAYGTDRMIGVFDDNGDDDPDQELAARLARPGDILIVGDGTPKYGDHICIVEGYDAADGTFRTVEGNGTGAFPDGKRGHGIVRAQRPLGPRKGHTYIARRLIRPLLSDLLPDR